MRQGSPSGRRPRGRHSNSGGNGNGGQSSGAPMRSNENRPRSASSLRHQTFDSNGPDVRVRGNAWQVHEKYQSLARDAASAGDRVMAENYLQHAEHYYRITEAIEEAAAAELRQRSGSQPAAFGGQQQPDVPANYYTPDGQLAAGGQPQTQPAAAPRGAEAKPATQQSQEPEQAVVEKRNPVAPSPFFATDEADDTDSGPQTLVAQR